jgi:hypothetical protein
MILYLAELHTRIFPWTEPQDTFDSQAVDSRPTGPLSAAGAAPLGVRNLSPRRSPLSRDPSARTSPSALTPTVRLHLFIVLSLSLPFCCFCRCCVSLPRYLHSV